MPDPVQPRPQTILCATDLSSRCDRALDRAAVLAREWQAQLVVVHALETASDFLQSRRLHDLPSWRRPEGRAEVVARLLRSDMVDAGADPLVVVEPGQPRFAQRRLRSSRMLSSSVIPRPKISAMLGLVRSSAVGPRPPLVITAPVRSSASRTAAAISSGPSPTVARRTTGS